MKRLILLAIGIVLMASVSWGASISVKATWTPNIETDMAGYNLYRTDGTRVKTNAVLITHPPVLPHLFTLTVPDNSQGTATFVLTAVDLTGNESGDSSTALFPFDVKHRPSQAGSV